MRDPLEVQDSSPFGPLEPDEKDWLRRLQQHLLADDHVVRLGAASEDAEPVVYCDADGRWRAGRYVGSLHFEGVRLNVAPRFDFKVLMRWLDPAFNFIAVPQSGQLQKAESFVPWLLAMLWSRRLDDACRHGLPTLRVDASEEGVLVRGRLDVRGTVALRRRRPAPQLASRTVVRSLENDIVKTLICAEQALRMATGSDQWQTRRVRDLCAQMRGGVGSNPRLPSEVQLARIRYTPIRLPFRDLVRFSHRLARRRGFTSSPEGRGAEGILLDVAELWELFVVQCARAVAPDFRVQHGTRELKHDRVHLFRSVPRPDVGLGQLLPDILVSDHEGVVAVLDPKYKRLGWAPDRPDGVDRGDRYQLAAYVSRFRDGERTVGALIYPEGMSEDADPLAAKAGPWLSPDGNRGEFIRVPVDRDGCIARLGELLSHKGASGVPAVAS